MSVEHCSLENGVQLLIKDIPHANSISIGFYARVSLPQESQEINGIAHFLEHLCFKGTKRRSAKDITEEVDQMGGVINAHTAKEYTCYYMTVLSECYEKAIDILSDIYLNSQCRQEDIETERRVVHEEINMYEDTPDEMVHDLFSRTVWQDHPLGLPILGTTETLARMTEDSVKTFQKHYFNPKNLVISIAGKIKDKATLIALITEKIGALGSTENEDYRHFLSTPESQSRVSLTQKKTEQVHLCLGVPSIPFEHPDHYKLTLLSTLLGGSMSSRLFQEIREKRGWAYAVYSYNSFYHNAGLFTTYLGLSPDHLLPSLSIILDEFKRVSTDLVTEEELSRIKEQLKGNLLLSLERSSAWMSWIAKVFLYRGTVMSIDEVVAKIESVTREDLQGVATSLFKDDALALSMIGPFEDQLMQSDQETVSTFLATAGAHKQDKQ